VQAILSRKFILAIPSDEKHEHGATTTMAMTHIAIQEQLDGKTADWMEKVSQEQYSSPRQDEN
jgi:quercetin dioxygenase-like cupin family protein